MRALTMVVALTFIGPLVLSTTVVAQERDPYKMVWRALKTALSAPEGTEYFRKELKGTSCPRLKGIILSASLDRAVSKLVLGMTNSANPEVTLNIRNGRKKLKKPPPGRVVIFEGLLADFVNDPFMVTIEVESDRIEGLDVEN
jgi:hypothetical protein